MICAEGHFFFMNACMVNKDFMNACMVTNLLLYKRLHGQQGQEAISLADRLINMPDSAYEHACHK